MIALGRCVCGHEPTPPTCATHPWAALTGYGDCLTFFDADDPWGLPAAPAAGSIVAVRLQYPFVGAVGAPFWCTFDPNGAFQNGYDACPDDLLGFRLLKARIVDEPCYAASGREAEARAEILEAIDPATLLDLAPTHGALSGLTATLGRRPVEVRRGPLRYKNANVESDLVVWSLAHQDEGGSHLLVVGESGQHENHFHAGNRPLSAEETRELC